MINRRYDFAAEISAVLCAAFVAGCSSGVAAPSEEVHATASSLTGTVTIDDSCFNTSPVCAPRADGKPTPTVAPDSGANVARNIQIADAYMRVASNSPAFNECLQVVMREATNVPDEGFAGPYSPCVGDPQPATFGAVLAAVHTPNPTRVSCNYCRLGTDIGGQAGIGSVDGAGSESIELGNVLAELSKPAPCAYNPDNLPCISDWTLALSADAIAHEIMHTHGYDHVDGGGGCVAPPGVTLDHNSSIPYEVGECIRAVLDWSEESGHMHDRCPDNMPGLNLVDSVLSGSPDTQPMHCVSDPYSGAGGAPVEPVLPKCKLTPSPAPGTPVSLDCIDAVPNQPLETRPVGSTGPWVSGLVPYQSSLDYRVCGETLYGKACTKPIGCPYRVLADTRDATTTTFSWLPAPWVDHYTVRRTNWSGSLMFPGIGTNVPGSYSSISIPFNGNEADTYSVCAYDTPALADPYCCSPVVTPTNTTCFTTSKCRVHGKEVIPTDTDDPDTWCSAAGGILTKKQTCTVH